MKKFDLISKAYPHFLHGGDYNPEQWLSMPHILDEDMKMMREANCNEMTVGIFSWSELEPEEGVFQFDWLDSVLDRVYSNGGRVVLATPSGARPAWMAKKYPEVMRVQENGHRDLFGERHNHCRVSPIYREKVRIINEKLAKRYGRHPAVVAWHLSNEYNGGACYCPHCVNAFRIWLREKYEGNIDRLNFEWWSRFWSHKYQSFEQIEPPKSDGGESRILGLNLDWKRFISDMTVDFAAKEAEVIRKYSDYPITTNCMCNYIGFDHYKMARVLDVASNDFYPRWSRGIETTAQQMASVCALYRGLKNGRPFMVMESAPGINLGGMDFAKVKTDEEQFFEAMLFVACGADTIQYFQWRKGRGGSEKFHGAVVDHYGKTDNRVFQVVRRIGEALKKLEGVLGTGVRSKVAIVRDYETIWALDGRPNHSHQGTALAQNYQALVDGFFGAAWKNNVSVDIIGYEADLSQYQMVCFSIPYLMNEKNANRLKQFVKQGGILVSTYLTAVASENDLCHLGGVPGAGLMELFGLRVDEVDTYREQDPHCQMRHTNQVIYQEKSYQVTDFAELIVPNEAKTLAYFTDNIQAGKPAVLRNDFGKGTAYYIGYHPDSTFLEAFMKDLWRDRGWESTCQIHVDEGVRVLCREGDGETYAFVLNCAETARDVEVLGEYRELLNDALVSGKKTLQPLEIMVLRMDASDKQ